MTNADQPRVLTVRQPWADAIAHGTKRVENRSQLTRYRGPLWIHAGLLVDRQAILPFGSNTARRDWPDVRGAVIATAWLAGCHQATEGCCAPWGLPNLWHWQLEDVRPLAVPVSHKGALGLRVPPFEVRRAVLAQQVAAVEPAP